MASILPNFEYDIFISYRQKDNEYDGWVTEFVENLKKELKATFKQEITIYFDQNPDDGLLETHQVSESLNKKLKAAVFIPIVSQTYCDSNSFAWGGEFIPFVKQAATDNYGLNIQTNFGNVISRVLPIKIHELEATDQALFEQVTGGIMRGVDFIYKSSGVNRPLRPKVDDPEQNAYHAVYRDQINKVANTIKSILKGMSPAEFVVPRTEQVPTVNIQKELVERRLYKVALVYVLLGLLAWKFSDLAAMSLEVPEWWNKWLPIVLIVLFPLAITMAWFFELTPNGFVLIGSKLATNNPLSPQKRKPLTSKYWIIGLFLLFMATFLLPSNDYESNPHFTGIENKSIAVLYFDNMSGDPEQEYFSDGITEEITARLAKIEGLRVISRTSTRVYKGQPLNLKKIAKDLNVSAVLEGSFRKVGNKIKVTAQLIDAETDAHIWAETFDRDLKDVFQVQSDIAHEIAKKFEVEIASEVEIKVNDKITSNTEAYDYYLRARHIAFNEYYYNYDSIDFVRSKTMYERAIGLDNEFAEAYAGLADLYDARGISNRKTFTDEMDSTRHALSEKAYKIDPNSAFVNNVRIWMMLNGREEPLEDSAFYFAKRALELDPNDYYNYKTIGTLLDRHGLLDMSIPFYKKAIDLNPLEPESHASIGFSYWVTDDILNAKSSFENAFKLEKHKNYSSSIFTILWFLYQNDITKSETLINNLESKGRFNRAMLKIIDGKFNDAAIIADSLTFWWFRVESFNKLNQKEKAIESFPDDPNEWPNNYLWLKNTKHWQSYHSEPRFKAFLDARKLVYEENRLKYGLTLSDFNIKE